MILPQHDLQILPELQQFIPPLLPTEREALRQQIIAEGCHTPLIVWRKTDEAGKTQRILVDGHNRKAICDELGAPYQTEERTFADIHAVLNFMAKHQLGRRNLSLLSKAYMIGGHYHRLKRDALDNLRKDRHTQQDENGAEKNTAVYVGRLYGISESTVKRNQILYEAMRLIEIRNPLALSLCFQLLNAKELRYVEFIAQASEASIKNIKDQETLYAAVKEGKANTPKAQSEPSAKAAKTRAENTSQQTKLHDTIYNQSREIEKHKKTIEQLDNRLKKIKEAPPQQESADVFLYKFGVSYYILGPQSTYVYHQGHLTNASYQAFTCKETNKQIPIIGKENFENWIKQTIAPLGCVSPCSREELPAELLHTLSLLSAYNLDKATGDTIKALREQVKGYEEMYGINVDNRRAVKLMGLGFRIYRLAIEEKRIKLLNEKCAWTSPPELRFETKAATQRRWNELMKDEDNLEG